MYVKISVNIPSVMGVFDYHLPDELADRVTPGCLVVVPFGSQTVQGIVLDCMQETSVLETRPVLGLLEEQPVLNATQIALAKWMSHSTHTPLSLCLDLMVPQGLSKQADTLYRLNPIQPVLENEKLSGLQQRVLDTIAKRGELRGRQLAAAFPHQHWKPAARTLTRRGNLLAQPILPPPSVRPKLVRNVQLACAPDIAEEKMEQLGKGTALARRQSIIRFLLKEPWPVPVAWVYAASGGKMADLQYLADQGLVVLGESEIWRDSLESTLEEPYDAPTLTANQSEVWEQIRSAVAANNTGQRLKPFLLYGVTGSGKTEIYLHTIQEILDSGRQAIFLVPEIALTPQTLKRISGRFPGQVGIIHSRLSPGERYDTWRRARAGQLPIVIGPRSALFTPFPNLGLIVIDECHDDSYYQAEVPYYHAVQAALKLAELSNCPILMGSATPGIHITYQAHKEAWNQLKLPLRISAHQEKSAPVQSISSANPSVAENVDHLPLPEVQIVDMRSELKTGNRSIFSQPLQQALKDVLDSKQQAILFLNRRGSATYVFCRECGHSLQCPRCDLPLTYHTQAAGAASQARITNNLQPSLRCHSCNFTRRMPETCPQCRSSQIRQYGAGTEKVESEVQSLFPDARVLRWDAESTRRKGAHEILLSHFINHRADILIGTQMLAKGLDLPLVTLVGVVLADVGLNFPDYRASERTFQLLMQVAGRAGRSALGGKAIFQTFQPDHTAIRMAAQHSFDGFYQEELAQRRRLRYPPFYKLARLEIRKLKSKEAEDAATVLARSIKYHLSQGKYPATDTIGPVPCFFSRVNGYYRWQIILRSPDPLPILNELSLNEFKVEIDPPNLL
jgi:primosomal protein N' (replication factor Y) (superfamily II helicase)